MLKVMTVVGTRPEIIRLSRVIAKLDQHCRHVLVHTGQNYDHELSEVFFQDLSIRRPDSYLGAAGGSPAETIGRVIATVDHAIGEHSPDAFLVLGDTNSCLAVIAAKRRRVPVFHMEAGNRCFDMRVPEEINRRIVDHVADVNLTYSAIARDYLIREGLPPDLIINTGSPMLEVLEYYREKIAASDVLRRNAVESGQYFVASVHREENVDCGQNLQRIGALLNAVALTYGLPVIVSTHPRTRGRIEQAGLNLNPLVRLQNPLGFTDYVRLQKESRAVLSDSGTITEESSILNFPALNIRQAHERPEGMEEAAVMMVGLDPERVLEGLEILRSQLSGDERTLKVVRDYDVPNVSEKVVRIIHSYTGYVNRVVWRRDY
jgi:UDP-N-acetylglucosamine 2-epimerase (non-hydrolysing)